MNTEQMITFAREQLEIFSKNSQMGIFLRCVIDELDGEKMEQFKVGDIVEKNDEVFRATLLDEMQDNVWYVITENGCIEVWEDCIFTRVGETNLVRDIVRQMI